MLRTPPSGSPPPPEENCDLMLSRTWYRALSRPSVLLRSCNSWIRPGMARDSCSTCATIGGMITAKTPITISRKPIVTGGHPPRPPPAVTPQPRDDRVHAEREDQRQDDQDELAGDVADGPEQDIGHDDGRARDERRAEDPPGRPSWVGGSDDGAASARPRSGGSVVVPPAPRRRPQRVGVG